MRSTWDREGKGRGKGNVELRSSWLRGEAQSALWAGDGTLEPFTSSQHESRVYDLSGRPLAARQSAASELPVLAPRWEKPDELTGFRV